MDKSSMALLVFKKHSNEYTTYIEPHINSGFSGGSMVKNLPAVWETWVRSLDWEDPQEEGMATHPSILAWRIPMDRGAWRATVHGVRKSQTQLRD